MWLIDRMRSWGAEDAIVWQGNTTSYADLVAGIDSWDTQFRSLGAKAGSVVALEGDYSPGACGLLLSIIALRAIAVPLTGTIRSRREELLSIAEAEFVAIFDSSDRVEVARTGVRVSSPLIGRLQERMHPGLILFSSGSTGTTKAALHDVDALLEKFRPPRRRLRTLSFLLLDHMGGINTLFYALSNGGCVVTVRERTPDAVARAIERHRIQLLPASPTFLALLMASGAHRRHDLSSLELITYGTEVMPERILKSLRSEFPRVELQQTYGLSEVGVLRSKSRSSDSLWMKVGGEGIETKVVDGTLRIRAKSAMLGYLNAPSPFDDEGWLDTDDVVDVEDEYIRIRGRRTDIINVGGQKVYPAEVESALLELANIRDVTVFGEAHPLMGQVVAARVVLEDPEDSERLKSRIWESCRGRLDRYKIPVRVEVASDASVTERFKRLRPTN